MIKKSEDADMQDASVHVLWRTLNIPNLLAIAGATIGIVTYINNLDARLANVEEYRVTRGAITDKKFDDIQATLSPLQSMPYRVNILEQQATAINVRIDRFTEIISTNLELLRKDVNALSTKVEVLSQKIDGMAPEKRAEIDDPPPALARRRNP